jgi:hypothetical protein
MKANYAAKCKDPSGFDDLLCAQVKIDGMTAEGRTLAVIASRRRTQAVTSVSLVNGTWRDVRRTVASRWVSRALALSPRPSDITPV